jgi:hypothetical protein
MQFNWTVTMGPEERHIPYVDDAFAAGRKVGLVLSSKQYGGQDYFVQKLFYSTRFPYTNAGTSDLNFY